MTAWTNPIDYQVGQATCVSKIDEQVLDNITFAGCHSHSGSAGDGSATLAGTSSIRGTDGTTTGFLYIVQPAQIVASGDQFSGETYSDVSNNFYIPLGGRRIHQSSSGTDVNKYRLSMSSGSWAIQYFYFMDSGGGSVTLSVCLNSSTMGSEGLLATTVPKRSSTSQFFLSGSGTYTMNVCATGSVIFGPFGLWRVT